MRPNLRHKQAGFVLAVSMIFLIVMTMLAVTAIKKSTLDEKISNTLRAQDLAFQAAEKALRFCERQIMLDIAVKEICTMRNPAFRVNKGANIPPADSTNPMANFPMEWANMANWAEGAANGANRLDGVDKLPNVASQPQCMIERWETLGGESRWPYVITARGVGSSDTAVVWLQAILRCGTY
jgi:type IV pilus assembly protein PilX